ncbi:hypothetical protein OIU34_23105 [Pararhizobium sp. BT-229]|uniref:hypothetical protein n=1 Tax=Pararhizobium sp. BT-229 TaxID=2986923 RepID=UPI0021F7B8B5|nr:hypothetical protein [Pararhizobium sp. BT-229]MCV9964784.1 hypothetical protein [Pararhizobium sp. BT-229]
MSDIEVLDKITSAVAAVISEKKGGVPLTFAGAYEVAHSAALEHFKAGGFSGDDKELARVSHSATLECYHSARRLIAGQFVGSTITSLIEDVASAASRFPTSSKADATPDLEVLAKHPDNIDLWGLLSYAIAIRHVAYRELEQADADLDGELELVGIERAVQLLHLLTQEDILVGDLVDGPFNGAVRDNPRKAPPLLAAVPSAQI